MKREFLTEIILIRVIYLNIFFVTLLDWLMIVRCLCLQIHILRRYVQFAKAIAITSFASSCK